MSKPLVLVTGASGHIGFRTLATLLENGYRARVCLRKLSQADGIKHATSIQPYVDHVEFVHVPDILAQGAFDTAVQGVEYVLHLASPIPDVSLVGHVKEVYLEPAVKGTVGMLESAAKSPSVKRVVITSSVVVLGLKPGATALNADVILPEPDPDSVPQDPWAAYRASKVLAHHAADRFMEEKKPHFDLIRILPTYVQGRNELVTEKENVHNGSNDVMMDLCLGAKGSRPRYGNTVFVDDVALAEVGALDAEKAKSGQNFLCAGSPSGKSIDWMDVLKIAKREFPEAFEKGILHENGEQETIHMDCDVRKTEEAFGFTFRDLEVQVKSLIGQYVELAMNEKH